jgi:hypothetical protein
LKRDKVFKAIIKAFYYFYRKSQNMAESTKKNQIQWVQTRASITQEMNEDLLYIKKRTGIAITDIVRQKLILAIEEYAKAGLHVGEKRHLRIKQD